ncbi:MAG: ester cyclase family protein [Balneolaceae bacterium]|nr:ester cyclase family protein [Balneolaceae bacterium]
MNTQETKTIAKQMAKAAAKGHKAYMEARENYFARDAVTHHVSAPEPLEWDAHTNLLEQVYTAFPDLEEHWGEIVVEDNRAIGRWVARATHEEEFQGTPATGKTFSVNGITIYHFDGGKVKEQWIHLDVMGMLQQLGVIPTTGDNPVPKPSLPDKITIQDGKQAQPNEKNKELVRQYLLEVWGNWDYQLEKELVANDFIDHGAPPNFPSGLEGHHQFLQMCANGFPEVDITVEDLISEGDKVGCRWTLTGEHQGEFMGVPASGNDVVITGTDIHRIENEKLKETWPVVDMLGMMNQMGAGS